MRLQYIHRMRGLAILCVVGVHCADQLSWPAGSPTQRLLLVLFQESTTLFFIIAGFLFHYLSGRFQFGDYLVRKLKYVIIPFVIISAPGIAHLLMDQPRLAELVPEVMGKPTAYQAAFFLFYAGEQLNYALWFVPVMATFFLMAPLFIRFAANSRGVWLLAVLIALSLVMHRPSIGAHHHLLLVLYYLGPYMLGIWISANREPVSRMVNRYLPQLMLAFAALVLWIWWPPQGAETFKPAYVRSEGIIDWLLLQKCVLLLVLMGLTRRWEKQKMPVLDYIAEVSFPIFFLHLYMLSVFFHLMHWEIEAPGSFATWALSWTAALAGSVALASIARLVLTGRSRYLIGA